MNEKPTANNEQPRQPSRRMPTERYVVYVDHQPKNNYSTRADADAEAKRILDAYPVLCVEVADAEQDSATVLGALLKTE